MKMKKRGELTEKKLRRMRSALVWTMYLDLRIFGYRTESVKALAKQIRRERAGLSAEKRGGDDVRGVR